MHFVILYYSKLNARFARFRRESMNELSVNLDAKFTKLGGKTYIIPYM